ncbi:MAG TPA: bifunctional diaminohydroxyphosphoribosylaminopyrimidine deaminase/5-amino-6-(5-phosphoribosylamino)uracil reductase RibD [Rhodospirillales bacterium]|jgi:diaminohydroxyphosphoribosylaminopyrimidine deaminase/5-amino-6-(5-phosphoribosylamino)uracil reductase|nr:MAG: Riboflavin biosynthesis protein RibD [Alphaproteobacteria bacterium MarineAlpha3_Bin1]PPR73433.1 MAG: Riboflavin biosynthesis protein RibD [Alphaproteobacteria bacterium MarineAlpha3_Bin2]HIC28772.1 bifunctional diaminohydroxyphosphoribosylaminopyrimidine deaminase/5-amino-6-(5-phosphoribosylamino)uracil reductase RibD [Rhodospirillales bacterium]HIM77839.1 bifunctional diaminohydroxyphosphoribosylaminopyrimidine deaminase/5-amino-6-(5-phosphoribosylamino)uracil reductase RibD [Rhodospir
MHAALVLARRGLGSAWPNPAVGCVLAREDLDGRIIGRGWTQPGGRPHAETEALSRAGALTQGATAYVTLEPCDHQGETPPCTEALIAAGVTRCVIAIEDPDPRVSGAGIRRLANAGVETQIGLFEQEARHLNAGFLMRVTKGRPLITLKTATTLDGRVATAKGQSKWITGAPARAFAHGLRAENDAIMIGIGTALADQPSLTCRLPGMEDRSPVRIVADSTLRLPVESPLVETAGDVPTWVVTVKSADQDKRQALEAKGIEVIEVAAGNDGRPDLIAVVMELGGRGLTRLLVESGGDLAAALIKHDLADRLAWFRSPKLIGGDGKGAVAAFGIEAIAEAPAFVRDSITDAGDDVLETYRRAI